MSPSPMAFNGWAVRWLGLALLGLLVAGCSEPRMDLGSWERVWDQTVEHVEQAQGGEIVEEDCIDMLSYLREQRPRLNPLPAEGLENPVDSWFEVAQAAFFDCPPDGETMAGWGEAFERLSVLEAEVATVLARHR